MNGIRLVDQVEWLYSLRKLPLMRIYFTYNHHWSR